MAGSPALQAMQDLLDGFHALADEVLRHTYVDLRSLKPHGINAEGKPIGGTPDSYVGPSPEDCVIAVEYTTTKSEGLKDKFTKDYDKVIKACKKVKKVILCTNRPETEGVADTVLAKAKKDKKKIKIVWGEELARILDDHRQDLRKKHLDIPLRTLTQHSLIPALHAQVLQGVHAYLNEDARQALQGRIFRRPIETQFNRLRPTRRTGITLVIGDAGQGKTTWSAATAVETSRTNAATWFPTRAILKEDVNTAIINATYGTKDQGRIDELAVLLKSTNRKLVTFIDAIDEHPDYNHVQQALQSFRAHSPLAKHTHIVLTCRTEALDAFECLNPNALPPPGRDENTRRLYLDALHEQESEKLLQRLGATPDDIAILKRALPPEFFGNPLYLKLARQLQEGRALPKQDTAWIDAFAQHYVDDITKRLQGSTQPAPSLIRTTLGQLAQQALQDPQGADPSALTSNSLLRTGTVGEGTFLERAVQSGILVRNNDRVRFCHALLCEYFAADLITADTSRTAEQKVQAMASLPGRASLARFAMLRDADLITHFARQQPALVESFDAAKLDEPTKNALVEQASTLLKSKYPSERHAAVRILGTIKTPEAAQTAVNWFNKLDRRHKTGRIHEAAELFLQLELPGAVQVVALHRNFWMPAEMAWYEPTFARTIERLSEPFKKLLADHAAQGIEQTEPRTGEEARFTTILAYLQDARLLTRLGAKAQDGPLAKYEHRALIHLNTDEAMKVYLASRKHYRALDDVDPKEDKDNGRRAAIWYELVPKQGDIVRFPHDALVRLAKQELRKDDWADVGFGLDLADTLQRPDLVDEYADAVAQRRKKSFLVTNDMIPKLVAGMDADSVINLYKDVTSVEARKAILQAAGDVPSDRIEQLLLDALDDDHLFNSACVGLTKLRSGRAGPELHQRLPKLDKFSQLLVIKALGRLRYEPALEDLITLLAKLPTTYADNDHDTANAEYNLIGAIGEIGGTAAYDTLAERCSARMSERILSFLLDSHDEYALQKVHEILKTNPNAKYLLGTALDRRGHLHDDTFYYKEESYRAEFDDDNVLDALLESAREHLQRSTCSKGFDLLVWDDCRAIALFDSPKATQFFEELAKRDPDQEADDIEAAIRFARNLLGHRGNRQWAKAAIEQELEFLTRRQWISSRDEYALRAWPRDVVREVLLERIKSSPARLGAYLYLLVPFANKGDEGMIRDNLDKVNTDLADSIKQQLPAM